MGWTMQIQYFKSAWGDIRNSPGWFGKLCLLALLNFIPIFGSIVTYGYLYGWAREIAWGVHEPLPSSIFANNDGKFWRRGWFIFVLALVVGFAVGIVTGLGQVMMDGASVMYGRNDFTSLGLRATVGIGLVIYIIGIVAGIFLNILVGIGSMRISIYDRLSAGFQLGKIWKMFRYDTGGAMRILGMELLVSLILNLIIGIIAFVVLVFAIISGITGLAASGYNLDGLQYMSDDQAALLFIQIIFGAGLFAFLGIMVVMFFAFVANVFVMMLVARAFGYWTMKFDLPHWRGQDDPMPFEAYTAAPAAVAPAAYPTQEQPVAVATPNAAASDAAAAPATPSPDDAAAASGNIASFGSAPSGAGAAPAVAEAPATMGVAPETSSEASSDDALQTGNSHSPHGIEDGQASDANVGEDSQPHVGESQGGQD